jgi:3-hydroxyacyl-CoA dehydrogenase/enoyl-CoA hydratase/3-hydroxybutyryl-CoA epimerase
MEKAFSLKINKDGIATLLFDLPKEKVNKLHSKVLKELSTLLDKLQSNKKIKVLLIESAKKGIFIAGADINEIKDITDKKTAFNIVREGQNILSKIEALPYPTIAVINGACMGGGTELVLCCDFRVMTDNPKAKIALPEVNLGIIPGFGGTQRMPRLIGLMQGLQMILSGKAIDGKKALKIKLIDGYFPEAYMKDRLPAFIERVLQKEERDSIIATRQKRHLLERFSLGRKLILKKAKDNLVKKTNGHYPAPFAALSVISKTYGGNLDKGLKIEAREFANVAIGQISKNLIDLFFISETLKKETGVATNVKTRQIKSTATLGAGIMGGGIAWLFSKIDLPVRIKDVNWAGIGLGYKQINSIYQQLKKIRKMDDRQINLKFNKITSTLDYRGFDDVDLIVEAVIEDIKIKKIVFSEVEKHVKDSTIIASNTSALSINKMAKAFKKPERFIGMHFFNPVNRMPLVEVIPGKETSDEVVATIVEISKKAGKVPIVVQDCAGFLVNRILLPYMNEAMFILEDVGDIEKIDAVIKNFGMPMGPFALADEVGVDVGYKVAKILEEAYGERMQVCPLLEDVYKKLELLGKKSGKGFYIYGKGKKEVNQQVQGLSHRNATSLAKDDILDRAILTMVNEAAKCLEEKVVIKVEHLDIAMIMGTGFPAFRGGLLKYVDQRGIKEIVARLHMFEAKYGKRFTPSKLLVEMADKGKKFYS